MTLNLVKLHKAMTAAGLPVVGVDDTGRIDWEVDPTGEQISLAAQIIAAHDPTDFAAMRKAAARGEAALATQLRALTPQQAMDYIETDVTTLATAKTVMKIMARMLLAMRDEIWPDLPDG